MYPKTLTPHRNYQWSAHQVFPVPILTWDDASEICSGRLPNGHERLCISPRPGEVIATALTLHPEMPQSDVTAQLEAARRVLEAHRLALPGVRARRTA